MKKRATINFLNHIKEKKIEFGKMKIERSNDQILIKS